MPVGQVISSHTNIHYVQVDGATLQCKARGKFRLEKQDVLVGDRVEVLAEGAEGRIEKVLPRTSCLTRPPVANVDQVLVLFTLKDPEPDFPFLDRVLVHVAQAGVDAVVILNKIDLLAEEVVADFCQTYGQQVGYPVVPIAAKAGLQVESLTPLLAGRVSVLAGHSGVGKSRLIRALQPDREDVRVGELSEKLGRGKHTTRHVELIPLTAGGYVADAPGFTYLEFTGITKWDLAKYFREFREHAVNCRFDDCLHNKEPDCGVRDAVQQGKIPRGRYENYLVFLQEVEAQKRW